MNFALRAMPMPTGRPCPNEPVAISTNDKRGVGWPSRSDVNVRNFKRSLFGKRPASAQAAYSSGAAWPFDSTNRSLLRAFGFLGSYRMTEKNSAATISAAEQQLDGCPLPASLVARTLSIRRCVALFCSSASNSGEVVELAIGTPFGIWIQRMLRESSRLLYRIGSITVVLR